MSTLWARGRYEAVAEHISGIAGQTVTAAHRLVPLAGADVVDLACGTGRAAVAAADLGARVTAVDLTPELITLGAELADGRPITWVTADAADTGLPAASFDAVVSNMGIVFVDPDRQLAEIRRLLKPGAALAFSSWVRTTHNPFYDPIVTVFGTPPAGAFSPDQWGDAEIATARLESHFTDIAIETHTHTWKFDSLATTLGFLRSESPLHVEIFSRADDDQQRRLHTEFEAALRPHIDAAGAISFDVPYVVISARFPAATAG